MKGKMIATAISGIVLCMLLGTGAAFGFLINLTVPNEAGIPVMRYATVGGTVDGSDNSIFHFKVNLAAGLESTLNGNQDNFGLDKFFFNTDLTLQNSMIGSFEPSTWEVANNGNGSGGFGKFSLQLKDTSSPRPEYLYFDIDYTTDVTEANFLLLAADPAGNGNGHFSAHIAGFSYNNDQVGSTYVRDNGVQVPELQSVYLLGIILMGLISTNRRVKG